MAGWEQVLAEVLRTRRAALVAHASLYTLTCDDAERVLQDAVVRAFGARRRPGGVGSAEAAIRREIRVLCGERARTVHPVGPAALDDPPQGVTLGTTLVDARAALRVLTTRQRLCVVAVFFDELAVADAADDLGMSEAAVRRHLADGTAALRRHLGECVAWPTGRTTVTTIAVDEGLVS